MRNTGKVTCNVTHTGTVSLAGWRGPVTHGLYGYCALVHHTMRSTQNVDWAGMDRWKHSLCLYWHVLAHCWHWRGLSTWSVTWTQELWVRQSYNNCIDRWNLFCHMQQPFHRGGRVIMHGLWLGFTERPWLLNLS